MKLNLFIIFSIFLCSSVYAQSRCDCTKPPVGSCSAKVEFKENWFTVKSNSNACSRVIWYTDETPQITIVTDGIEREEWLGSTRPKSVHIESCDICLDRFADNKKTKQTAQSNEWQQNTVEPEKSTSPFEGNWVGYEKNPFGKKNKTSLDIKVDTDTVSIINRMQGSETRETGKITGNVLTYSMPNGVSRTKCKATLSGPNTLNEKCKAFPFSFKTTYTRQ